MTKSFEPQLEALRRRLKKLEIQETIRKQIKKDPQTYFSRKDHSFHVKFELPQVS